jgi:hypothetical protein
MKYVLALGITFIMLSTAAQADTCYELWYERNEIYDANGFCFKTKLGKETFDNSDCYTDNVNLTPTEQRTVDQIRAEERRLNCKINR